MALKSCRECGAQVSTGAATCPHCGVKNPTQQVSAGQGCLGCFGIIVVIGLISSLLEGPGAPTAVDASGEAFSSGAGQVGSLYHAPSTINVRGGRGTDHGTAFQLSPGEEIYVGTADASGWAPVFRTEVASDTAGFVLRELLRPGGAPALLLVSHEWGWSEYGNAVIRGEVRNTTGRPLNYGSIHFNLLDRDGAVVGSAWDNVANLGPGQSWRFEALVSNDRAARYQLMELNGF